MKGVIFNLLQAAVTETHGADLWDDLVDEAGVDGAYTSLGNYDEADLEQLVAAAGRALGLTRAEVLRWFGRQAMPHLASAYPVFFEGHRSATTFLAGINDVIHVEVRKLYVGAVCPHFNIQAARPDRMDMDYHSPRRLCALAHGFVEGAARHFGETVEFRHLTCVERGDAGCTFRIGWPALEAAHA
ncbi:MULTISPECIES: heme NO-binding domain-containing protein [unclassified Caulobacter]|uniref:heme NO-binding domain-containing protein n=1 Tax=unclassified Caulobacter TaxID=2648921 RepID=UPI000D395035|nr:MULTISPECIES: heme NO-binding domain-containing protein [unclassified Caulobacter]PTS91941.1 heme NO-binding protein [Caulobacter sp. HMWF009]PTT11607.1 heme NO-binding protein [Caulobacter sp. HMWF025]PTT75801.1 heme NO-binding protein [Pseudomonas sp. HMWF010]